MTEIQIAIDLELDGLENHERQPNQTKVAARKEILEEVSFLAKEAALKAIEKFAKEERVKLEVNSWIS